MNDDFLLALYPKPALAKDAKIPVSPQSPSEFSIGHIVSSKEEVDEIMEQARKAGATITYPDLIQKYQTACIRKDNIRHFLCLHGDV